MTKWIQDVRDEPEHPAVANILATLAEDHPARAAYAEGADTIQPSHMVPELVKPLTEAFFAGHRRFVQRQGYFRP